MTLEANLQSIADSLKIIADLLTVQTATKAIPNAKTKSTPEAVPATSHQAVPDQAPANPAPVVQPVAPNPVQNVMPAVPVFTPTVAPVVAPSGPTAPVTSVPVFADKSAMMDWVMATYKALGTEKGAKIQDVLTGLGYKNINDVLPEQWGALKAGIDSLKG